MAPVTPTLDRDRLLADLRAAAKIADPTGLPIGYRLRAEVIGLRRAWRVIAAAIEDGEYDDIPREGDIQ